MVCELHVEVPLQVMLSGSPLLRAFSEAPDF
jgi:hypothetical protein